MKSSTNRSNFGAPSIVLIVTVIGIVLFSLLAFKSSFNERKLAVKSAEGMALRADMNLKAELVTAELDDWFCNEKSPDEDKIADFLLTYYEDVISVDDIYEEDGVFDLSFTYVYTPEENPGAFDEYNMGMQIGLCFDSHSGKLEKTMWKIVRTDEEEDYMLILPD